MLCAQSLGSCPTSLQAAQDSLSASYTIQPAIIAELKNFSAVAMWACYSADSYYDRAWRAPVKANLAVRAPVLSWWQPSRACLLIHTRATYCLYREKGLSPGTGVVAVCPLHQSACFPSNDMSLKPLPFLLLRRRARTAPS